MDSMLQAMYEGLQEIFPEMGDMVLTYETKLQEIPDWDSMSSVNLQVFLEQNFGIFVSQDFLGDNTTIGEILVMKEMQKEAA
ncbi:MAG: hypothetical protein AB7S75_20005 [Desulfococcaceae bacterium]